MNKLDYKFSPRATYETRLKLKKIKRVTGFLDAELLEIMLDMFLESKEFTKKTKVYQDKKTLKRVKRAKKDKRLCKQIRMILK